MSYGEINGLAATYVGCADGWYLFEDENGQVFEFDDVKMDLMRKYNLNDESHHGKSFDILFSSSIDDEVGYEELVIVGLKILA